MLPDYLSPEIIAKMNTMSLQCTLAEQGINVVWIRIIDPQSEAYTAQHQHTFCEAHICLGGAFTYNIAGEEIEIGQGQGIAVAPGCGHFFARGEDFIKCAVAFTAENGSAFYEDLLKIKAVKFNAPTEFYSALKNIALAISGDDCFSAKFIECHAFGVIHSILKTVDFPIPAADSATKAEFDPRLAVAKRYIRSNKEKMLSCEDVAQECGLSAKQLGRLFKKYAGQSLAEYIKDCKLKDCEELLLNSRYSVKEVAFMLGFENEYYFGSFFKRHYGMPPGAFKKQNAMAKEDI